uniref:Lipoprotein n=1 Tax=viral metagenome TaxID=1070528 RepID=A0A6M3JBF6_9ZZZZ
MATRTMARATRAAAAVLLLVVCGCQGIETRIELEVPTEVAYDLAGRPVPDGAGGTTIRVLYRTTADKGVEVEVVETMADGSSSTRRVTTGSDSRYAYQGRANDVEAGRAVLDRLILAAAAAYGVPVPSSEPVVHPVP